MDIEMIFVRLGLGKHASSVYECLLASKEPVLATHLARVARVARPQLYRNLRQLLHHKFVKKIEIGKRSYYLANNPRVIEEEFRNTARTVSAVVDRHAVKKEKLVPEYIRFFKGFGGIRAVFDDVVDHTPRKETFYRYTSERDLDAVNRYLSPSYRNKRDQKKLERLVISNPVSGSRKRPRLERFIKYIQPDADVFNQNIIQITYGDRLAFINLNTEEAFVIEDRYLASFQRAIFKQLYKKL